MNNMTIFFSIIAVLIISAAIWYKVPKKGPVSDGFSRFQFENKDYIIHNSRLHNTTTSATDLDLDCNRTLALIWTEEATEAVLVESQKDLQNQKHLINDKVVRLSIFNKADMEEVKVSRSST